ncbi:MAG: succinylglutamate-semialdehyde dehydrogenase [Acidimicrobiales bacterium]
MNTGFSFIDGAWVKGAGGLFVSLDPSNGKVLWTGVAASKDQVVEAVVIARSASRAWSNESVDARIEVVERFAELLKVRADEIAAVISAEVGKPLWESTTEVAAMVAKFAISVQAHRERSGKSQAEMASGSRQLAHRPHGVMAVFGPFNFPGHLPNGHIIPALIAGNTVVFKPSEQAPASAEIIVKCWQDAGIPAGVLNLVQGGADVGRALAGADIDGLLFTGSARTGRLIHKQFGGRPQILLALELGGNNPLVIHEPSSVDGSVYAAIQSAFLTAGQRCTAANRILLRNGSLGDEILDGLVQAASSLVVGAPDSSPTPFMGPVISEQAASGARDWTSRLQLLGATVLTGPGDVVPGTGFVLPTIVEATGLQLPDEEMFGPVVTVQRYDDLTDAIVLANETSYGLSASLLSQDEADWKQFFTHVRAGIVNWNRPTNGAASAAPFGGVGASGNHRPSAYYAADYCSYPVASMLGEELVLPDVLSPGVTL